MTGERNFASRQCAPKDSAILRTGTLLDPSVRRSSTSVAGMSHTDRLRETTWRINSWPWGGRMFICAHWIVGCNLSIFSFRQRPHTQRAANNRAVSKKSQAELRFGSRFGSRVLVSFLCPHTEKKKKNRFLNRDSKIEKWIALFRSSGNAPIEEFGLGVKPWGQESLLLDMAVFTTMVEAVDEQQMPFCYHRRSNPQSCASNLLEWSHFHCIADE